MEELRILDKFIRELHKTSEKSFVDVKHAVIEFIRKQDWNKNIEQLVAMVDLLDLVDNDIDQAINFLVEMKAILTINRSELVHRSEQGSDVQTRPKPGRQDAQQAVSTDSGYVSSTNSSIITQPEEDLENPRQGSRNLIAQPQDAVEYQERGSRNLIAQPQDAVEYQKIGK